ncbi:copper uptake system-associated protein [Candidatus Viadribacter manganicus]|uniref:Copper uptake system-associated protein n=1 Tax=Candidatus Viadribacter manganicus TaxID=1759059 RepID=A0A1B1AGQ6_9PROT|nr:copper uptake system-associated protein [Candidatus Viadribacter manganicus]ANP45743.1 hypothetical protein ATE48_07330 [Candidatus Viadribacter manganicus]
MITITRRAALSGAALLAACARRNEAPAIEAVLRARWDRPDAPLEAGPIVIEADLAIADWTQGSIGGRALLQKRDGVWSVSLCAGDELRTAAGLQRAGISRPIAAALAFKLNQAERRTTPQRLSMMSRFDAAAAMGSMLAD